MSLKTKLISFFLVFTFYSCALVKEKSFFEKEEKVRHVVYQLKDLSGVYKVNKRFYFKRNKVFLESKILNKGKLVEKGLLVFLNDKNVGVPIVSQVTTWINGTKYFTEVKSDNAKKRYVFYLEPSQEKRSVNFVNSNRVCPFLMLDFCLEKSSILKKSDEVDFFETEIWILWDNFPLNKKIFSLNSYPLIQKALLSFEGIRNNKKRFTLEISGESISLVFDLNNQLEQLIWVAQGYSLKKL